MLYTINYANIYARMYTYKQRHMMGECLACMIRTLQVGSVGDPIENAQKMAEKSSQRGETRQVQQDKELVAELF